jgi:hypothetical protein
VIALGDTKTEQGPRDRRDPVRTKFADCACSSSRRGRRWRTRDDIEQRVQVRVPSRPAERGIVGVNVVLNAEVLRESAPASGREAAPRGGQDLDEGREIVVPMTDGQSDVDHFTACGAPRGNRGL